MNKWLKQNWWILAGTLVIAGILGSGAWYYFENYSGGSLNSNANDSSISTGEDSVSINVSAKEADFDWSSLPTKEVDLSQGNNTFTEAGTYTLSGTTTSGVVVNSEGNVRLILNGVNISNTNGVAIYVENANNTVISLQSGTSNIVSDASNRSDETLDGAIFSHDDLFFTGEGSLTVTGNFADGIVSKDDLFIFSGNITVSAKDDGIRGKDSLQISGGNLTVKSGGDALKATNDTDISKGYVVVDGGTIKINSGSDGIQAISSLVINGGEINIENSAEGLEATNVTINGGTISIYAAEDGVNASQKSTGSDIFIRITGGKLTIEMANGDTDALDANGNLYISGGTINITAQFAFDFDGTASYTGGAITVNGSKVTSITNSMMGGAQGGRR